MSVEYLSDKDGEKMREAIEALEQEPCDDAISREDALLALTGVNLLSKKPEELISLFDKRIKALPSVTPKQKKGKWKLVQIGKRVDLCCANCGSVRIEEIAYNYTIDELNKFFKEDFKECLEHPDMSYCPCCGSKMESGE